MRSPKREQGRGEPAGQRLERGGGVPRIGDRAAAHMDRGRGRHHDEEHDDDRRGRTQGHIGSFVRKILGAERLVHDVGLDEVLPPRSHGGADHGHGRQQVRTVPLHRRHEQTVHRLVPVGMGEVSRDHVRHVEQRHHEEDPFDPAIAAAQDQQHDERRPDRDGDVLADVEHLHRRGDARELGGRRPQVRDQQQQHHRGGRAHPVPLADQGREPLAGHHPEPGADLLGDEERDARDQRQPQELVPELGAHDRVRGDPLRVVVGGGRDQPGAEDRQERHQRAAPEEAAGAATARPAPGGAMVAVRRSSLTGGTRGRLGA